MIKKSNSYHNQGRAVDNLMKIEQRVVIFGSNLVMSTIGKSLQERTGFQIHQIDHEFPDIKEMSDGQKPDVILFDLASAPSDLPLSWLRKHSAHIMIGVDIENSKMLVLSGAQSRLLTADDLVKAIENGIPNTSMNLNGLSNI
jgi:hypothetical protein